MQWHQNVRLELRQGKKTPMTLSSRADGTTAMNLTSQMSKTRAENKINKMELDQVSQQGKPLSPPLRIPGGYAMILELELAIPQGED